ncbi:Ricin B-like lectins domain-containing protein, partial [Dioscorea alata]
YEENPKPNPPHAYESNPKAINNEYTPSPPSFYQPGFVYGSPPLYLYQRPPSHAYHCSHDNYNSIASLLSQPSVRVYTKADENYSLSIRDGQVVLVPANSSDKYQHWIKDMKYSTKVKDKEGYPAFALVNKITGEAIKHSVGATQPVRLVTYNPEYMDDSVLWAESNDTGEGFHCIRMVNNIHLNFDAFHGVDHGDVHDGTIVVLWEWLQKKNQRWKITPY